MSGEMTCDLCVIGAGFGGLSVAAGASQMGANVVLIEKGDMGVRVVRAAARFDGRNMVVPRDRNPHPKR